MKKTAVMLAALLGLIFLAAFLIGTLICYNSPESNVLTPAPTPMPTPTSTPKPNPTITPTPEPKPLKIEVNVTPWGDMYRHEPDCKEDFSVELVHPNQNENFTTVTFDVVFNAGAYFWIVEKAYYTSDLFSGERWINISKEQYTQDLQKTFTFNLANVPDGQHELTLTVIFHEGTRNNATVFFSASK